MDSFRMILPWITAVIVVLVMVLTYTKKNRARMNGKKLNEDDYYRGEGIFIGAGIGAALGALHIIGLMEGICFGLLIGMAVGYLRKKK